MNAKFSSEDGLSVRDALAMWYEFGLHKVEWSMQRRVAVDMIPQRLATDAGKVRCAGPGER